MATLDNRTGLMLCCFAFTAPSVFEVNGLTLWGMGFEGLPGGSMLNSQCTIHGLIGIEAEEDPMGAEPRLRTVPGAPLSIYATMESDPEHIAPYQEELIEAYRERMAELGLHVGA